LTFFYDIIILGSETRKKFYVQYFTVRRNNMMDFKKNQAVSMYKQNTEKRFTSLPRERKFIFES